jgi:hypothetical protein
LPLTGVAASAAKFMFDAGADFAFKLFVPFAAAALDGPVRTDGFGKGSFMCPLTFLVERGLLNSLPACGRDCFGLCGEALLLVAPEFADSASELADNIFFTPVIIDLALFALAIS